MSWMNFFTALGSASGQSKAAIARPTIATERSAPPWIAFRSNAQPVKKQITPFLVASNPMNPATNGQFSIESANIEAKTSKSSLNPTERAQRTPTLRVVCIGGTVGSIAANDVLTARLRISGRACDVRAELDRMAA